MSLTDKHAVERAAWSVAIKTLLKDKFICKEHFNDYSTMLMVTHAESPGWKAKLTILTAGNARNRVELNDKVFSYSVRRDMLDKLFDVLTELRQRHDTSVTVTKEKEATYAQWSQRQEMELAELADLPALDVEIIRRGPHVGQYRVTLFEGHPLEHLTLEQFKTFHAFLQSLSRS